jgi:peptidoglycan/LPS O-acetylase OafA/YrhL
MQTYKKQGEILSLTGLRGLAALLVVITHYWAWTKVTSADALPASVTPWMETSGMGMAIFFALSGYVITLSYAKWDWRNRPLFNLTRLFFYRLARLYPAFFVFALMAILRFPALQDLTDPNAQGYLLPHLLLWQAWWPVKYDGVLASDDFFHVSWSLSVECALYLAFGIGAIILAVLPRWRFWPIVLGVILLVATWELVHAAWSARQSLMPDGWTDLDWYRWLFLFSPYAVSLQFIIGVAAYRISLLPLPSGIAKLLSNAGAVGLLAVYVLGATGGVSMGPFMGGMYSAVATGLLMAGASSDSITNRLLSGRVIVYVGTISYSLYLFHYVTPPLALHGRHFDSFTPTAAGFHAINFAASLALAIIFSTGVYTLVEVPGRRWIRAMADQLLGLRRAPSPREQGAPAE